MITFCQIKITFGNCNLVKPVSITALPFIAEFQPGHSRDNGHHNVRKGRHGCDRHHDGDHAVCVWGLYHSTDLDGCQVWPCSGVLLSRMPFITLPYVNFPYPGITATIRFAKGGTEWRMFTCGICTKITDVDRCQVDLCPCVGVWLSHMPTLPHANFPYLGIVETIM